MEQERGSATLLLTVRPECLVLDPMPQRPVGDFAATVAARLAPPSA